MNILEASKRTGVSKDMIRFYEKKGMIHPARNEKNNYRIYSDHDLNMIVMIHTYNSIGMSLKTVSNLLNGKDLEKAETELKTSIKQLQNEEMWIRAKLNNAIDMANLFDMISNEKSYEIGEREDCYCYTIKNKNINNIYSRLAENGGIARAVFRIKNEHLKDEYWPENHALLFAPFIDELRDEIELIPAHKFYRVLLKHENDNDNALTYSNLKKIIENIKTIGYEPSGDVYIYQIMGNAENDYDDHVCVEVTVRSL